MSRGIYRRRGAARGGAGAPGAPLARPGVGPHHLAAWVPGGAPWPSFGVPEASVLLIFILIFLEFLEQFKLGKNLEQKDSRK